jgi:3-oxoacyl-[acyl-carrier protein] reductase
MYKLILIIGASSDIGINLINNLEDGYLIIAHYNSTAVKLLDLSIRIKNKIILIKADLSDETQVTSMINNIYKDYGVPNIIIHLASPKFRYTRFKDVTWDIIQNEVNISLKSITMILINFLPLMAKAKSGKIVCMLSSVVLNVPPKSLVHYTTVKYAILGLIKSLASEYANKNIQINAISPSMINTKFLSDINYHYVELSENNHPLKRNANTMDIIPLIKLLISDDSNYISGANIPVTGGSIL